jgi:ATP-dependent Clp protease ATP-binding subunit ClpC
MEVFDEENNKNKKKTTMETTSVLDNFTKNLSKMAEDSLIEPIIGRDEEIKRVIEILSRKKKNNPILIGEPGVGKSSIAYGLALKIYEKKCPINLSNKKILSLDLNSIIAGTKYRGQFEERMKAIMKELEKSPNIIIFIDEIHNIVGAGNSSGSLDLSNIIKPSLADGSIQCIGATTLNEYRENIEKDGALTRRFQKVIINPTNKEQTLEILNKIKKSYEEHHKVLYTDSVINACVELSDKYITDRFQPDKAIDLLDEVGAQAQTNIETPAIIKEIENKIQNLNKLKLDVIKKQKFEDAAKLRDDSIVLQKELSDNMMKWEDEIKNKKKVIKEDDVFKIISKSTGIPIDKLSNDELKKLSFMSNNLKKKVIGQDLAIEKIVNAIKRSRMGVKKHNKPIATFLFLGSTGVGKTFLCKKISEELFGTDESIIRLDMSEYMEKFSVSKLIGAPPGYVGYEEGGQLTEKVRRKPYSIVLFDEIEKAHSDIYNILLQILDEGHLTDSLGRKIDFKNTLIIMTSNVGVKKMQDFGSGVGFTTRARLEQEDEILNNVIEESINKTFSPEFINRIDDIIIFNRLTKENIKNIISIPIDDLIKRIKALGYHLVLDKNIYDFLSDVGYNEKYGARPLNRAIQKYLEDTITDILINKKLKKGCEIYLHYDKENDKIIQK